MVHPHLLPIHSPTLESRILLVWKCSPCHLTVLCVREGSHRICGVGIHRRERYWFTSSLMWRWWFHHTGETGFADVSSWNRIFYWSRMSYFPSQFYLPTGLIKTESKGEITYFSTQQHNRNSQINREHSFFKIYLLSNVIHLISLISYHFILHGLPWIIRIVKFDVLFNWLFKFVLGSQVKLREQTLSNIECNFLPFTNAVHKLPWLLKV